MLETLDDRKFYHRNRSWSKLISPNFSDLHFGDLTFGEVHTNRDFGRLDQVPAAILSDLLSSHSLYPTKPILISEYGADTVTGLHNDPSFMFTEEYQKDFYTAYHGAFDNVSSILHPETGFFIGELPWNMFDFATDQTTIRVGGLNRKGLFTRQRQPKAAAFVIKNRYEQLESIQTPSGNFI